MSWAAEITVPERQAQGADNPGLLENSWSSRGSGSLGIIRRHFPVHEVLSEGTRVLLLGSGSLGQVCTLLESFQSQLCNENTKLQCVFWPWML